MSLTIKLPVPNLKTGEVEDRPFDERTKRKPRQKEFVHMRTNGANALASLDLSGADFRLLFLFISSCHWANRVVMSRKQMYELLQVTRTTCWRSLTSLINYGLVARSPSTENVYYIAPQLCFRGDETEYRQACVDYMSLISVEQGKRLTEWLAPAVRLL